MAKKPEFIQNLILEKIKEKVPGSKFSNVARAANIVAGLYIGDWEDNSWIGIKPGVVIFQWRHKNNSRYTRIPVPSFEDPKFDADKIIDFVVRLAARQRRVIDLIDSIREESEIDFYAISGNKLENGNGDVIDYPGPEPVRNWSGFNPFRFR